MDNVKIPQNIKIEDKIIGPLSLRQLLMIAAGGGVSYSLFAVVQRSTGGSFPIVAHAFVWWPLLLTAAFALVRINDISLTRYLMLIIENMLKPRVRPWLPRQGIIITTQLSTATKTGLGFLHFGRGTERKSTPAEGKVLAPSSTLSFEDLVKLMDQQRDQPSVPGSTVTTLDGLSAATPIPTLAHANA